MPRLPNAHLAIIDDRKITRYLLDVGHPDGGPKAAFFVQCSFQRDKPEVLVAALLEPAQTAEVTVTSAATHGAKFVLRGSLQTPGGRTPVVQAIWIVDAGQDRPRLVTAYPV